MQAPMPVVDVANLLEGLSMENLKELQCLAGMPLPDVGAVDMPPMSPGAASDTSSSAPPQLSDGKWPSLFLGGIPQDWNDKHIVNLMGGAQIRKICMKQGYCFVDFEEDGVAEQKASELDGNLTANGKVIGVRVQTKENHEKSREKRQQILQQQQRRQDDQVEQAAPAVAVAATAPAAAAPAAMATPASPTTLMQQQPQVASPVGMQGMQGVQGVPGMQFAAQQPQMLAQYVNAAAAMQQPAMQPQAMALGGQAVMMDAAGNLTQVGAVPQLQYMMPMQQQAGLQAVYPMQVANVMQATRSAQPTAVNTAAMLQQAAAQPAMTLPQVLGGQPIVVSQDHTTLSGMSSTTVRSDMTSSTVQTESSTSDGLKGDDQKKRQKRRRAKRSKPSVFVGGLRADITEREIRNFFGVWGKILFITVKEGFAFIDFSDEASALLAVEKCNGYVYDGKPLGVRIQDAQNRKLAQSAKKNGDNVPMLFRKLETRSGPVDLTNTSGCSTNTSSSSASGSIGPQTIPTFSGASAMSIE